MQHRLVCKCDGKSTVINLCMLCVVTSSGKKIVYIQQLKGKLAKMLTVQVIRLISISVESGLG